MTAIPRGPDNDLMLGEFTDRETLRFVRDFAHPPQTVWQTLVDKAQYKTWLWECTRFEARLDGQFRFDISGQIWEGRIREFEPERRLDLGGHIRFELFASEGGCRLIFTLKRPPTGWSPMALAGYQAWLGRLTRLIAKAPREETEAWASDLWEGMFPVYERLLRRHVSGGAKIVWRLHFDDNAAALTAESAAQLDELVAMPETRSELNVVVDGFGDDSCSQDESLKLCRSRVDNACAHLRGRGIAAERIAVSYVLGNYHPLVSRETQAGRAFNRRIELRPTY
ncbi:MAG TPA: SRPBCC domain-containing protein [Rhizomicrobium sp.]